MARAELSHKTIHVRVDVATTEYLEKRAKVEGRPVSSLVYLILKREREMAENAAAEIEG